MMAEVVAEVVVHRKAEDRIRRRRNRRRIQVRHQARLRQVMAATAADVIQADAMVVKFM